MRSPFAESNFSWIQQFPLCGLGSDFNGDRWIQSASPGIEFALGHGDLSNDDAEAPRLITGFIVTPSVGTIDLADTLGTRLVLASNERLITDSANPEERKALVQALMQEAVPAITWVESIIRVDDRELSFKHAEAEDESWVAFSTCEGSTLCVQASHWPADERFSLVTITDLSPYEEA